MERTVKTVNGYLPFFGGFYESNYENSDTEYNAIREAIDDILDMKGVTLEEDDLTFDTQRRREDICNGFVEAWSGHSPEYVSEVIFDKLVSPRYYNFATDEICANVGLDDTWKDSMKSFMDEFKDKVKKILYDEFTSYDGFMSYMSNDIDTWEAILFHSDLIDSIEAKYSWNEEDKMREELHLQFPNVNVSDLTTYYNKGDADKYIIHMIAIQMAVTYKEQGGYEDGMSEAILYDVMDEIYDSEYVDYTESGKAKIEEAEEK